MNNILKNQIRKFSTTELLTLGSTFGTNFGIIFGIVGGFYLVDNKIETNTSKLSDKINKVNEKFILLNQDMHDMKNILQNIQENIQEKLK